MSRTLRRFCCCALLLPLACSAGVQKPTAGSEAGESAQATGKPSPSAEEQTPPARGEVPPEPAGTKSRFTLLVGEDGIFSLGGEKFRSGEDAARHLNQTLGGERQVSLVIAGHPKAPLPKVVALLDALRAAGYGEVELSIQGKSKPTPAQSPGESPAAPPGARSLPEVKVRNVGLHVGGGPNSNAAKAPFKQAVEVQFPAFRECYRHVDDPKKGGTFGVDLYIGRNGGIPKIRAVRTVIRGNEFRECVRAAFEKVEFQSPPRGPTVISYSLRFELVGL